MNTTNTELQRPIQTKTDNKCASVTVVIPVRNEEAFIARTLDQIVDQELEGIELEVFVVDGVSEDNTRKIVQQYTESHPFIHLLENPQRLSSAARNLAIQNSTGEYFVVIDGHCELPTRRYFIELVKAFEKSRADSLGRPQPLDVSNATPFQKAIALARSSRLGHHPESFIYSDQGQFVPAKSVAIAYRREVFEKIGLFDESFDAHEDGELNYRCDQAGLKCYLSPEITVKYFPRKDLQGLFRQMARYGRGRVRFSRKHPGTWGLGSLIPAVFVLYLVVGGIAAALVPLVWIPYVLGLAVYLSAVLLESARLAWTNRNPGLLFRMPLVFLAVHLGAGVGTLVEFLGGRSSTVMPHKPVSPSN